MNSSAAYEPNHCDCCIHERSRAFFRFLRGDAHGLTSLTDGIRAFHSSESCNFPTFTRPKRTGGRCQSCSLGPVKPSK